MENESISTRKEDLVGVGEELVMASTPKAGT